MATPPVCELRTSILSINSSTISGCGLCPDPSTNNIAEFYGFRECLRRAIRHPLPLIVLEGDSLLVDSLMADRWGYHRAHIRELLNDCYNLGEHLTSLNCKT